MLFQEIDWNTVNDLTSQKNIQDFMLKLLTNKDSFIPKIIDLHLAYSIRLTNYLDKLGLFHSVVFQNDLTVEITQLGQDLDFDNLSRGERNRLILVRVASVMFGRVERTLHHCLLMS